jgi:hypothetical protein
MRELLVLLTSADLAAQPVVTALAEAVPADVRVVESPGLLAPTPEGKLWRDAAGRHDAVSLVVAAPGPDLANHALLTVEAARAAGLAVGAVVVNGVPEPDDPGRRALEAHAGAPVVEVDPRDAEEVVRRVAGWPLEAWLAATPVLPVPGIALAPYEAWEPPAVVPDPRTAGRAVLMQAVLDIVAVEGPVLASRAFGLYNRAAGGKKLTSIARAPLGAAAYWLAMERRVVLVKEADAPWQRDDLLRAPDQPAMRLRELGPRTLEEVPLDEVAELMRRLRAGSDEERKRAVLRAYGLVRLTARADEYLGLALGLLERQPGTER